MYFLSVCSAAFEGAQTVRFPSPGSSLIYSPRLCSASHHRGSHIFSKTTLKSGTAEKTQKGNGWNECAGGGSGDLGRIPGERRASALRLSRAPASRNAAAFCIGCPALALKSQHRPGMAGETQRPVSLERGLREPGKGGGGKHPPMSADPPQS